MRGGELLHHHVEVSVERTEGRIVFRVVNCRRSRFLFLARSSRDARAATPFEVKELNSRRWSVRRIPVSGGRWLSRD
jgi:hypothetical protein